MIMSNDDNEPNVVSYGGDAPPQESPWKKKLGDMVQAMGPAMKDQQAAKQQQPIQQAAPPPRRAAPNAAPAIDVSVSPAVNPNQQAQDYFDHAKLRAFRQSRAG